MNEKNIIIFNFEAKYQCCVVSPAPRRPAPLVRRRRRLSVLGARAAPENRDVNPFPHVILLQKKFRKIHLPVHIRIGLSVVAVLMGASK